MAELPDKLSENVRSAILKDMRPSLFTVYLKSGLAVLLGGAASLLLCGQFGVGLTHASMHFSHQFHGHVHDFSSAVYCGMIFAILSPFLLRLISSPLQFRVIIRRGYHAAMIWLVGLGALLAHHGDNAVQLFMFMAWAVAAGATFVAVSYGIDRIAHNWRIPVFGARAG